MSSPAPAITALLWVLVGLVVGAAHLWVLHRALARVDVLDPGKAGARLALTFPLRLLAVAPILFLAARAGLWACLGLVAGSVTSRWLVLGLFSGQARHSFRWRRQG